MCTKPTRKHNTKITRPRTMCTNASLHIPPNQRPRFTGHIIHCKDSSSCAGNRDWPPSINGVIETMNPSKFPALAPNHASNTHAALTILHPRSYSTQRTRLSRPLHTRRNPIRWKTRARQIVSGSVIVRVGDGVGGYITPLDVDLDALKNQEEIMVKNRRTTMTRFMNSYDRALWCYSQGKRGAQG